MLKRVLLALQPPSVRLARRLAGRADAARALGHHLAAAMLYEESLRLRPRHAGRHIQAGHMFKEAGELARAERHYFAARDLVPDDADLALQIGHFYTVAGRLDEAAASYARAVTLSGGDLADAANLALAEPAEPHEHRIPSDGTFRIVPELLPRQPAPPARGEAIHLAQLGRIDRTAWGTMRTVRGVAALRGFSVSTVPVARFEILCDGETLHRAAAEGAGRKFAFNVWHDFSTTPEGRHQLEFVCIGTDGTRRSRREAVVVSRPFAEADEPDSDAVVSVDLADERPVEAQINGRPSVVRTARRGAFAPAPRAVLVQRVDQLGDLVASVPAIRRLREIVSGARLIGLLSPANVDLAATLNLFDEILVVDFPEDPASGRRVLAAAAQEKLARRLAPYRFDLAIDLSETGATRDLLLLSGARKTYAFSGGGAWLSAEMRGATHDPGNGSEMVAPSARMVGMVEWLGAVMRSHAEIVRRAELPARRLVDYGIAAGEKYVLLHAGARLAFSRWPHFGTLAALLLQRTGMTVVYMGADPQDAAALPGEVTASPRFRAIAGQLPFDDFDALLSYCAVMVGNDSGPKHLAALRGAPVISLHMARLNWSEWGQEQSGLVISRKVPCAGCGIHRDPDECGKGFACITHISPEEVFDAVLRLA